MTEDGAKIKVSIKRIDEYDDASLNGSEFILVENPISHEYNKTTVSQAAPVKSVNGKSGVVLLNYSDVGADVSGSALAAQNTATSYTDSKFASIDFPVDSVNGRTGAVNGLAEASSVSTALNTKVDKIVGKQLSTEDYTTTEKNKLASVESEAQANTVDSVAGKTGSVTLDKSDVGLSSVDNTADASKNVLSATKLTTARNVNGVSFDGTSDITVADATKEPVITTGTTAQYYRGDKSWQTLNKAAVGLANVDNTADVSKPISSDTKNYIGSRGQNLLTNGQALLGTNYNFTSYTLDQTDHPTGAAGSFYPNTVATARVLDEFIPVNPTHTYEMAFSMKQASGDGSRRFYSLLSPYDIDGLSIQPYHYMEQTGTRTTLAATLNPGDTTVTLTSASGWNNAAGANSYLRSFLFWNYTDGKGYTWPVGTYSRNRFSDIYADGAISGNVITLRTAWTGSVIPSGTAVSNGSSGSSYMYGANNTLGPSIWTDFGPYRYSGVHSNNLVAATTAFPISTAYVLPGFLVNYPTSPTDATSVQKFANVTFTDIVSDSNKLSKAGDTMTGDLTMTDAKNIILATTTGTKIGTATTQKLGFFNATPVVQQTATTDLATALANLGLRASGTAWTLTTTGAVSFQNLSASGNIALTGSVRYGVNTPSSALTLTTNSVEYQVCDATAAAFTITLPTTTTAGYYFTIKKTDASANAVTVKAGTSGTIDGSNTYVLSAQYKYVTVVSTTGSGVWYVVGNN